MRKLIISLFLCIGTQLYPQSIEKFSVDSGGASSQIGNLGILYTIGEVNVQEANVANIIISEGFINPDNSGALSVTSFLINDIIVYPNPASEFVHLKTKKPIDSIEIYNILGGKVLKTTDQKIDVNNLQSGLYFIKMYSGNKQLTKKIVIE